MQVAYLRQEYSPMFGGAKQSAWSNLAVLDAGA